MKSSSVPRSMPPQDDGQAMFLESKDGRAPNGKWKRNPIGLWLYAGLGAGRIILSGLSILLIRR